RFSRDWSSDVCSSDLTAKFFSQGRAVDAETASGRCLVVVTLPQDGGEQCRFNYIQKPLVEVSLRLVVRLHFAFEPGLRLHLQTRSEERRVGKARRSGS